MLPVVPRSRRQNNRRGTRTRGFASSAPNATPGRASESLTLVAPPRSQQPDRKKPAAAPPAAPTSRVLPMHLRIGDRLVDQTGAWEIHRDHCGRPKPGEGLLHFAH